MFFRRKKKEEPHKGDIFLAKGIYMKQPTMENGSVILNCFLRCLIVFLLVFGSVGGFLSAFRVSYNFLLVMVFYMILSMYFSILYATSKLLYRDVGYIIFFGLFVVVIYRLRLYANSGFYTIVNTVLRQAQTFFNLSGVREYETQISNDYLTVAIVAIFIGLVLIMVLNIWLSSSMSLFWTALLTFPLLLIPIYMKLVPDPLYVVALGIGYVAVVIFKANGHYLALNAPFRVKGLKKNRITYTQDAGIFRQILLSVAGIVFVLVILVETLIPSSLFEGRFRKDRLRDMTSDTIGNFVLLGFAGLFNQYPATGGISGGKLGGISNVAPDYQTDLVVSYAPYSNEPVYLKAYTGGLYGDNQWEYPYNMEVEEESLKNETLFLKEQVSLKEKYSAFGRMDIYNIDADPSYSYYPYYTDFEDDSFYYNHSLLPAQFGIGIEIEETQSYQYYPKIYQKEDEGEVIPARIDTSDIDAVFLDVPAKNREIIKEECEKIGLQPDMTENEIVTAVKEYFQENIPYTLKPGATPRDEDFINYFLTNNRKGYCAHFASAATLIFREMGIPARYVEGYAFSLETALASDINKDKVYSDYYNGYSALGESAVIDVEVTDAMAHAWVEIYIDNFGWKVVEVTPGSNETADEDDFWSAFSGFFQNIGNGDDSNDDGIRLGDLHLSQFTWLMYVILGIVIATFLLMLGKIVIRKGRRYRRCHQSNLREAVIACYADVCDMLRTCYKDFDLCRSHGEQIEFMIDQYAVVFEKEDLCRWIETISFSMEAISDEAFKTLTEYIKQIRKQIWKKANWKQKIALWKR